MVRKHRNPKSLHPDPSQIANELYAVLDQVYHYYGRDRIKPHFGEPEVWQKCRSVLHVAKPFSTERGHG